MYFFHFFLFRRKFRHLLLPIHFQMLPKTKKRLIFQEIIFTNSMIKFTTVAAFFIHLCKSKWVSLMRIQRNRFRLFSSLDLLRLPPVFAAELKSYTLFWATHSFFNSCLKIVNMFVRIGNWFANSCVSRLYSNTHKIGLTRWNCNCII